LDRFLAFLEERRTLVLACLCGLTLVIGAAYSLSLGDQFRFFDERWNFNIATNLKDGIGFSMNGRTETAFRPPGYPFLIMPFVALGASVEVVRFLNFVALAATGLLVYGFVRHTVARAGFAVLAAAAVMLYPVGIYTAGTLYPQTFGTLFLAVAVFLLSGVVTGRWTGRSRVAAVVGAGLALGVSTMIVPNHVFFLAVAAVWLAWVLRRMLASLALVGLLVISGLAIPGTWTVRNLLHFDEFFFVSSAAGLTLLLGNSENASADSGNNTDIDRYVRESEERGLDEFERDRFFRDQALEWIGEHKGAAATLYGQKLLNYFNPDSTLYQESEQSSVRTLVAYASYLPILALLVLRLAWLRRIRPLPIETLILWLYLSNAVFLAFLFTRIRYRLPLDLLLFGALAIFLARVHEQVHHGAPTGVPGDRDGPPVEARELATGV